MTPHFTLTEAEIQRGVITQDNLELVLDHRFDNYPYDSTINATTARNMILAATQNTPVGNAQVVTWAQFVSIITLALSSPSSPSSPQIGLWRDIWTEYNRLIAVPSDEGPNRSLQNAYNRFVQVISADINPS